MSWSRTFVQLLLLSVLGNSQYATSSYSGYIPPTSSYSGYGQSPMAPATPAKPAVGEHIDVIRDIEIQPTQLIVVTTKEGPADHMRVMIDITDLAEKRQLPVVDLSGLWLLVTRGRYTVPFLKPDHWYGIHFRSENIIDNHPIIHTEKRIVKTADRQGNITNGADLFKITLHRSLEGVDSLESVYMTVSWANPARPPNGELIVKVRVDCANSATNEDLRLHERDETVTIEISMDNRYELEDVNRTSHLVKAHISPLKCRRICWTPVLEVESSENVFKSTFPEECHDIKGTSGTTYLRNLKQYFIEDTANGSELVVQTELAEKMEEGFVTLSALRLDSNEADLKTKSFSTKHSNGSFSLDLDDDAVYAVSYEYTKLKPFHYSAQEHFLVEIPSGNRTRPSRPPVELKFQPDAFKAGEDGKLPQPFALLQLGPSYKSHDVHVHLDPLCNGDHPSEISLNANNTPHKLDLSSVLCSNKPTHSFCSNATRKCSELLCYSSSIKISGNNFPTETRCMNVSAHFPSSTSIVLSRLVLAVFVALLI